MENESVTMAGMNSMLQMAGVTTSSGGINTANIIANLIFGSVGFVFLMYGWKNKEPKPLVFGLGISIFPFFITNTILIYVIGTGLIAWAYFWRD